MALDEDQPQVSDVVDRTVQGRKGPPGLFGGGRLTVLRRLGRGRRGGRLRFVDVDADQYGPARLAGRSSCRAKSRDQNRQRADNPFRGDSGRDFPPRESWSVGRVHLTCPRRLACTRTCPLRIGIGSQGIRSSDDKGLQRPATQGNLQRQFSLIEFPGSAMHIIKGVLCCKDRIHRHMNCRQTPNSGTSLSSWVACCELNAGESSGCCSLALRRWIAQAMLSEKMMPSAPGRLDILLHLFETNCPACAARTPRLRGWAT